MKVRYVVFFCDFKFWLMLYHCCWCATSDIVLYCSILLLSGVPDFFDRNKILSGYDLSHRPHSRQVTEQLPLSGSLHSHQLVYLKAGNAASSENHWFLEVHFNVHCCGMSQSSFGQLLLCTFNCSIMMCSGRIKNIKLYIDQYLPALTGHWTPVIQST